MNKKDEEFLYDLQKGYKDHIPMNDLVNGGLYWIVARYNHVGIWSESARGFLTTKMKYIGITLVVAYHRDMQHEEYLEMGTAKPIVLLEESPFDMSQFFDMREEGGTKYGSLKYAFDDREERLLAWLQWKTGEYPMEDMLNFCREENS